MRKNLRIEGMSCVVCSNSVEKAVKNLSGINKAVVNLSRNRLSVDYDENAVNLSTIITSIEQAGFKAFIDLKETNSLEQEQEIKSIKSRLLISLFFLLPLLYIAMGYMFGVPLTNFLNPHANAVNFALAQLVLTLPIVFLGKKFYSTGFRSLFKFQPNMDTLIAVGTGAAIIYSFFSVYKIYLGENNYAHNLYFESAAVILTLITLGKYLEILAKGETSEAIKKLIALAPKTATVIRDEQEEVIAIEDVLVNDIIIVKPGDRIPTDGEIIWGSTLVDESMLTGESLPVSKKIGDKIIGASINKNGVVKMRATKVGEDTILAQIIALVENAQATKAPIAKMADVVASYFVPIVMGIAIFTAVFWYLMGENELLIFKTFISVLVIACPCALGLATPTSIMVGTGKAAESGILFKNGLALENTHELNTVVFDKTGTITEGQPKVTDFLVLPEFDAREILYMVAAAEKCSEHPLAEAIVNKAIADSIQIPDIDTFRLFEGRGIEVYIEGKKVLVGNAKLFKEQLINLMQLQDVADKLAENGKTVMFIALNQQLVGIIAVADAIKDSSLEAVKLLKQMNIEVVMLTGDNKRTAEVIAKQVGIEKFYAEVFPEDKANVIKQLQSAGRKVAMVGDGINDAPALAQANIGIAVAAGTDIAIEAADIVLMKNDLRDISKALRISHATIKNIKQNLFWAFAYNIICIPIAMGVLHLYGGPLLNPMIAGGAMSLSSVSVVTNSLRIKNFK